VTFILKQIFLAKIIWLRNELSNKQPLKLIQYKVLDLNLGESDLPNNFELIEYILVGLKQQPG